MGISDLLYSLKDPNQLRQRTEKYQAGDISQYLLKDEIWEERTPWREDRLRDYQRCFSFAKTGGRRFRVLALITAYEDPNAVEGCIKALWQQYVPIERILIVDNSSSQRVDKNRYEDSNVTLIPMENNVGISGSLEFAFPWAIEQGFDFIWTFDQDSRVRPDVLGKLLTSYCRLTQEGEQVGIVSPTIFDNRYGLLHHGRQFDGKEFLVPKELVNNEEEHYRCDFVIASGSLFNLKEVGDQSLPNPDLFIDAVDMEHCMNIRALGKSIIVHKSAIMFHCLGVRKSIRTFPLGKRRDVYLLMYSPMRQYYISRNQIHVMLKYLDPSVRKTYLAKDIINTLGIIMFCVLYIHDKKLGKIWALVLGKFHGITGRISYRWKRE